MAVIWCPRLYKGILRQKNQRAQKRHCDGEEVDGCLTEGQSGPGTGRTFEHCVGCGVWPDLRSPCQTWRKDKSASPLQNTPHNITYIQNKSDRSLDISGNKERLTEAIYLVLKIQAINSQLDGPVDSPPQEIPPPVIFP